MENFFQAIQHREAMGHEVEFSFSMEQNGTNTFSEDCEPNPDTDKSVISYLPIEVSCNSWIMLDRVQFDAMQKSHRNSSSQFARRHSLMRIELAKLSAANSRRATYLQDV